MVPLNVFPFHRPGFYRSAPGFPEDREKIMKRFVLDNFLNAFPHLLRDEQLAVAFGRGFEFCNRGMSNHPLLNGPIERPLDDSRSTVFIVSPLVSCCSNQRER